MDWKSKVSHLRVVFPITHSACSFWMCMVSQCNINANISLVQWGNSWTSRSDFYSTLYIHRTASVMSLRKPNMILTPEEICTRKILSLRSFWEKLTKHSSEIHSHYYLRWSFEYSSTHKANKKIKCLFKKFGVCFAVCVSNRAFKIITKRTVKGALCRI